MKKFILNSKGKFTITREFQTFDSYVAPNGFLTRDLACHALFRYYLAARLAYEGEQANLLAYEGDVDSSIDYRQLFNSWSRVYGVDPIVMAKFWHNVDMQCRMLGIPLLPDEERYRFNRPIVIKVEEPAETQQKTGKQENANSADKD